VGGGRGAGRPAVRLKLLLVALFIQRETRKGRRGVKGGEKKREEVDLGNLEHGFGSALS